MPHLPHNASIATTRPLDFPSVDDQLESEYGRIAGELGLTEDELCPYNVATLSGLHHFGFKQPDWWRIAEAYEHQGEDDETSARIMEFSVGPAYLYKVLLEYERHAGDERSALHAGIARLAKCTPRSTFALAASTAFQACGAAGLIEFLKATERLEGS